MDNKIAELTDRLYKEGVEKGEHEAQQIIDNAKSHAAQIVVDAKKDAEKIINGAQREAEEQKRNAASEIKLSGQQALSYVRQQILDVLTAKVVDKGVKSALDDPAVMKEILLTVVQNWKGGGGRDLALEVLLPESKKQQLEKSLVSALQGTLKKGVNVSFSRGLSGGFQIGPQDGSFKLSLTEDDFAEFFKEFLRPKARSYLFGADA